MKFLALLLLVSCSTSNYILEEQDILPYKETNSLTRSNQTLKPFKINIIKDMRKDITYGNAYTGVKYQKTPIVLSSTVQAFTKDFFNSAFEMRNIHTSEESSINLNIDIKEIWVEEIIEKFQPEKAKCRVEMVFHIENENKEWNGSYWTEYLSAGDLSDGTERLAPTLASCLNQLVEKLVNDDKFIKMIL
jgi:uncharacterized lipoprotein YajG